MRYKINDRKIKFNVIRKLRSIFIKIVDVWFYFNIFTFNFFFFFAIKLINDIKFILLDFIHLITLLELRYDYKTTFKIK